MTRSTNMEHVPHLQRMANEAWRGSPERAALDAAIASLSAPKPEGDWVLVPREPSKAMVGAWNRTGPRFEDAYTAMLAAAPQPPAEAQAQGGGDAVRSLLTRWAQTYKPGASESVSLLIHQLAHALKGDSRSALPSAPVGVELLCQVYADAYHHGHHATVEGGYIDVLPVDRDTFWREQVEENYTEALAQQPAAEAQAQGGGDSCPHCKGNPGLDCNSFGRAAAPPSAAVGVEADAAGEDILTRALNSAYEHGARQAAFPLSDCARQVRETLAQQPAAVDGDWRKKAAEWLEAKAVQQEAANQKWTEHAACYKEWRDRPGILRYLAIQVLDAQPGGSDNDR